MFDIVLGIFWIFLGVYSPIAVFIGLPMIVASYYEIAFSDPKEKPAIFTALFHSLDYYFHTNFEKNKDYMNSFLIGHFFLITGGVGIYILYKGFIRLQ